MIWLASRKLNKHQKLIRRVILTRATVAAVLILIPILSIILDPLQMAIRYCTAVRRGSLLFDALQSEVQGARLALFVFNVTNAARFQAGADAKLRLQEVGPFTYREIRKNIDIELDEEAGEMWFTPDMRVQFLPEESVADPRLVTVTVPSLSLMSATSLLRAYPAWVQQGFNVVARQLGAKMLGSLDAHSFLWGYDDPLIALANRLAPGLIYFDRLGIIDKLYENRTMYRMKVGVTERDKWSIKVLRKYLRGRSYKEQTPLEDYKFTDTYEGVSFPPGVNPGTPLNIYRTGVCRPFGLEFAGRTTVEYGPRAMIFRITNETFHQDCGLPGGMCGILDLSKCTYGIPIAISRTHFLHSDPRLFARVEGMAPDPALHDSVFVMESKLGFELQTNLSLQLNMALGDVGFHEQARPFANMTVPIAYINVVQPEMLGKFKVLLSVAHVWGPAALLCAEAAMLLGGAALLLRALHACWRHRHCADRRVPLVT